MGIEIERKFLVNAEKFKQIEKPNKEFFRQGYLLTDPKKTIRVRQTSDKGFITIKGISVGASRAEFEYEIPREEAKELLDQFAVSELSKYRTTILFEDKCWEVDEFLGKNEGLWVAEIELTSEDESFTLPDWVGQEVTGDAQYYNLNLTILPFQDWE
jgi:CYTH domain-containing protein